MGGPTRPQARSNRTQNPTPSLDPTPLIKIRLSCHFSKAAFQKPLSDWLDKNLYRRAMFLSIMATLDSKIFLIWHFEQNVLSWRSSEAKKFRSKYWWYVRDRIFQLETFPVLTCQPLMSVLKWKRLKLYTNIFLKHLSLTLIKWVNFTFSYSLNFQWNIFISWEEKDHYIFWPAMNTVIIMS